MLMDSGNMITERHLCITKRKRINRHKRRQPDIPFALPSDPFHSSILIHHPPINGPNVRDIAESVRRAIFPQYKSLPLSILSSACPLPRSPSFVLVSVAWLPTEFQFGFVLKGKGILRLRPDQSKSAHPPTQTLLNFIPPPTNTDASIAVSYHRSCAHTRC